MNELFLKIINMSISASWLVLAVLVLRLVLRKAPKWVNVLLWGFVAVRLLCPFSIKSDLSLIPSTETFPEKVISGPSFDVRSGIPPVDNMINDYLGDRYFEGVTVPANNGSRVMTVLAIVWVIGMLLLLTYTTVSYRRLHREIVTAVWYRDNIFRSQNVSSPFVLGIINPRIYLPFKMDGKDLEHVVAHERAHIRRKDHWWKPLGFLLLTIHWFNPLMWLSFVLLCRDIELACDEKVIKELRSEQRADYAQALVTCSVNRHTTAACPLAFGEVGVKERVKSIMNYRKPTFWIILLAVIACGVAAVCFVTTPPETTLSDILSNDNYTVLTKNQADLTLTIDKADLPDDIYTREGHEFGKEDAVVYQTETTTIYLYKAMISNERDDWMYFLFDFSYDFSNYGKVLSPIRYDGAYFDVLQLRSKDLRDNFHVYPDALSIRGHGPGTMFAFYVSVDACKAAEGNILIDVVCDELIYAKRGYEEQAAKLIATQNAESVATE